MDLAEKSGPEKRNPYFVAPPQDLAFDHALATSWVAHVRGVRPTRDRLGEKSERVASPPAQDGC